MLDRGKGWDSEGPVQTPLQHGLNPLKSSAAKLPHEGYPFLVGSEMSHSSFFSGVKKSPIKSLREGAENTDWSKNILEEETWSVG